MNIVFKKIAAPVGVMAIAALGAFGTSSMKAENSLVDKNAYRNTPSGCQLEKICSTEGTIVCTIRENGQDIVLNGKFNETDTSCPQPLFERMPQ